MVDAGAEGGGRTSGETRMPEATPRDAATLILVRNAPERPEVLLGRRPASARFMPGFYVFPGGGIEADDFRAGSATELAPELVDRAARIPEIGIDRRHFRAMACAAVRETVEETGLLLGATGAVGEGLAGGWTTMRAAGLAPTLAALRYVGRAITPADSPIRFHARFFAAAADAVLGRLRPTAELDDVVWVPMDDVRDLALSSPTRFMLQQVTKRGCDPGRFEHPHPTPLFTKVGGQRRVLWDPA